MTPPLPPHAAAFDQAKGYDQHARVQRDVAAWLADRLRSLPRPARLLEIGGGTGFLREATGAIAGDWLLTDISPAMLAQARARLDRQPEVRFALLDAEHPDLDEPPFDLIAGSLVVQWFDDLARGLARLFARVAPGGRLIVTTLAAGSFDGWHRAHAAEGLEAAAHTYPSPAMLATLRPEGSTALCEIRAFHEQHADGRAFLHALKAIGAATPRPGHRPLAPAALRRVLHRWEADGASICYEVAMLSFTRPSA